MTDTREGRISWLPDSDPEQFSEYVNDSEPPSKNKAEYERGAREQVELPSVAAGTSANSRQMKREQEELGDPESD